MEILKAIGIILVYIYMAFVTVGLHIRMWGKDSLIASGDNLVAFYGVFWIICFPLSIFFKICVLSFYYLKGNPE